MDITILKVSQPVKSNSSYGNYQIAVDFIWDSGLKAGTFKYAWNKKNAVDLYNSLTKRIGKKCYFMDL